jgi:transposase-like protein
MKTITLATFDTPTQAESLKRRLEEEHISPLIHGGGILKHLWFVHRKAKVRLDVEETDFRKSQQLMRAWETRQGVARKVAHCPECQSSRIEYPQFTRKFFLPNLIGLLAGLGLVQKKYYCEDCHYTWSPKGQEHEDHRTHLAPNYFLEGVPKVRAKAHTKAHPHKRATVNN